MHTILTDGKSVGGNSYGVSKMVLGRVAMTQEKGYFQLLQQGVNFCFAALIII